MQRLVGATLVLAGIALAEPALSQRATCTPDSTGNPVCTVRIQTSGTAASDLGVYNVSMALTRAETESETPLDFQIVIDASECGKPSRRFLEERARFTDQEQELRFNFPLFLHALERGADEYCITASAIGCPDGCAQFFGMQVGGGCRYASG